MKLRRFLVWLSSFVLIMILILVIGIKVVAPRLIEKLAIEQIAELGVSSAALTIEEISYERVVVTGLRIGADADLEIPDLRAEFSPFDLFRARMKEIHISGLVLRMKRVDDGLSFGALDPLFLTSDSPTPDAQANTVKRWPIDSIVLIDSLIVIQSPFDTTYLPFSGRISQTPDREIFLDDTHIEFIHPNIKLKMTVQGKMDVHGVLDAILDIDQGEIKFGAIETVINGGQFSVSGKLEQINSFNAEGGFQIAQTKLPLGFQPETNYGLSLRDGILTSTITLEDQAHDVRASFVTVVSDVFSGNPAITIDLKNTTTSLRALPDGVGLPDIVDGQVQLDFNLAFDFDDFVNLTASPDVATMMDRLPELQVRLRSEQIVMDGQPVQVGINGNFGVVAQSGAITLRSQSGLNVMIEERQDGAFRSLFGTMVRVGDTPDGGAILFTLNSQDDLLVLSQVEDSEQVAIHFSGHSELSGSYLPAMRGDVEASFVLDQNDFSLQWFVVDEFSLAIDPLKIKGGVLSPDDLYLNINGGADWLAGTFKLLGGYDGELPGGLALKNARLKLDGEIGFADRQLALSLYGCGDIHAAAVRLSGVIGFDAPMNFCLQNKQVGTDLIVLDFDSQGIPEKLHSDLRLIPEYSNILIQPQGAPGFLIKGERRFIDVTGELNLKTGAGRTKAFLGGYDVIVPDQRLVFRDISMGSTLTSQNLDIETEMDIKIGSVEHQTRQPFIAPSSVELHVELDNTEARFMAKIKIANGLATVELEGNHNLQTGSGEALTRLLPLNLIPDARTLQVISPYSAQWIDQIAGLAIGVAITRWNNNQDDDGVSSRNISLETDLVIQDVSLRTNRSLIAGLSSGGEINMAQLGIISTISIPGQGNMAGVMEVLVENAYADTDIGKVERINGVINFDSLWPLSTPSPQQISIARIESGFTLTNGVVKFSLGDDGILDLHKVHFRLAGGEIAVEGLQVGPDIPIIQIPLVITGIDVEELTNLIPVSGLTATGIINGSIPIEVSEGEFYINQGSLKVEGGGVLSYRPQDAEQTAASNEYMGLALDILADFQYSDLTMAVEKSKSQDLVFHFVIKGANPAFYEGFPVELRLNVTGEISKLIRNELTIYSIPDMIAERIRRFGSSQ